MQHRRTKAHDVVDLGGKLDTPSHQVSRGASCLKPPDAGRPVKRRCVTPWSQLVAAPSEHRLAYDRALQVLYVNSEFSRTPRDTRPGQLHTRIFPNPIHSREFEPQQPGAQQLH
jgi:hypothetical protein